MTMDLPVLGTGIITFAGSARLTALSAPSRSIAALAGRGTGRFECRLRVPTRRIGYALRSIGHPGTLRDVITRAPAGPIAAPRLEGPRKLDGLRAGLCISGAGNRVFHGSLAAA